MVSSLLCVVHRSLFSECACDFPVDGVAYDASHLRVVSHELPLRDTGFVSASCRCRTFVVCCTIRQVAVHCHPAIFRLVADAAPEVPRASGQDLAQAVRFAGLRLVRVRAALHVLPAFAEETLRLEIAFESRHQPVSGFLRNVMLYRFTNTDRHR